jgi:hypothetical protein
MFNPKTIKTYWRSLIDERSANDSEESAAVTWIQLFDADNLTVAVDASDYSRYQYSYQMVYSQPENWLSGK